MIYNILAMATGAILQIMIMFNVTLGYYTSAGFSLIVNQAIAIIVIGIYLLFTKNQREKPKKAPLPYYFGGMFAVVIVTTNIYTVNTIGLTLTTASLILGQTIFSIIIDITGFTRDKKIPFNIKKLPLIILIFLAIAIMVSDKSFNFNSSMIIPLILAIVVGGGFTIIQMVINSKLSTYTGLALSTFINVVVGGIFGTIVLLIFAYHQTFDNVNSSFFSIPFYIIAGGSIFGIFSVAGSNYVLSKISSLHASMFISSGSIITSIIIDNYFGRELSLPLFIATVIILLALYIDLKINKEKIDFKN